MSQIQYAEDAVYTTIQNEPDYQALSAKLAELEMDPEDFIVAEFEKSQRGEEFDVAGMTGMSDILVGSQMAAAGVPPIIASFVLRQSTGVAYGYDGTTLTIVHEFGEREPLFSQFVRSESELGMEMRGLSVEAGLEPVTSDPTVSEAAEEAA